MVQNNYKTSAKVPVERFTCTTSLLHDSASGFTEFDPVTKQELFNAAFLIHFQKCITLAFKDIS